MSENQNKPVLRKNFKTFREAFEALPVETQKHSVRVAEYTKLLFVEAISVEMRLADEEAKARLSHEYERGAYLCGLYHDIGKVLVPEHYHSEQSDYSAEELALYRKHTTDGAAMVRQLDFEEELSDMEKMMIAEAIEFHHQKPDGTGFPAGAKSEDDIKLMGLIVSFANHVDFLISKRRSETPFDDVMKDVLASFPRETELELLAQETMPKLRRIFVKYQDQSLKIPSIIPFVKRKNTRPFELKYRAIVDRKNNDTTALQAKMYFKDNKDTFVEYEEVKTIINKNKLVPEIGRYFIYEAGDTMRRIETCELPIKYIALELMPTYYTQSKITAVMLQQLADARMEKGKILFSMDESMFAGSPKTLLANVERMTAAELPIFLTGWNCEALKAEDILKYSIQKVVLHTEMYEKLETSAEKGTLQKEIKRLTDVGVEVLAGDFEKVKYSATMNALGINNMTGAMAGSYITEDEIVTGELRIQHSKEQDAKAKFN